MQWIRMDEFGGFVFKVSEFVAVLQPTFLTDIHKIFNHISL